MPEPSFTSREEATDESARPFPLHGNQGDRGPLAPRPEYPAGLSIAISREAGARGNTIARRVGTKLGWQVFSQELMEYLSQDGPMRQDVVNQLAPVAQRWVEQRLEKLRQEQHLSNHPTVQELVRMVLSLAVGGEVILLGRGAGFILPAASTLHVRLVAPEAARFAYFSQWLRLTEEEAAEQVRARDQQRTEFLMTHFHRRPDDVHLYDLVLNTSLLGEELCADLIAQAARAKAEVFHKSPNL